MILLLACTSTPDTPLPVEDPPGVARTFEDLFPDARCEDGEDTFLFYATMWWGDDTWHGRQGYRSYPSGESLACESARAGAWKPNSIPHQVCDTCIGLSHVADAPLPVDVDCDYPEYVFWQDVWLEGAERQAIWESPDSLSPETFSYWRGDEWFMAWASVMCDPA